MCNGELIIISVDWFAYFPCAIFATDLFLCKILTFMGEHVCLEIVIKDKVVMTSDNIVQKNSNKFTHHNN